MSFSFFFLVHNLNKFFIWTPGILAHQSQIILSVAEFIMLRLLPLLSYFPVDLVVSITKFVKT